MLINISQGYGIYYSKFSSLLVKFIIIFDLMLNFLEIICLSMAKHGEIEIVVCVVFRLLIFVVFTFQYLIAK
jgi:hypothetical protein